MFCVFWDYLNSDRHTIISIKPRLQAFVKFSLILSLLNQALNNPAHELRFQAWLNLYYIGFKLHYISYTSSIFRSDIFAAWSGRIASANEKANIVNIWFPYNDTIKTWILEPKYYTLADLEWRSVKKLTIPRLLFTRWTFLLMFHIYRHLQMRSSRKYSHIMTRQVLQENFNQWK